MEIELWSPIPLASKKEVSNFGNIRNSETKTLLKQHISRGGYLQISFWVDGKNRSFKVHRLVAKAFVPNPENKRTVNHKDLNKLNNRADNFEWATTFENIDHYYKTGFRGKISDDDVLFIRQNIETMGCKALADKFKVNDLYILGIANGTHKKRVHLGLAREKKPSMPKPVKKFSLDGIFICEYHSLGVAAKENKTRISRIQDVVIGNRKSHGGFIYKSEGIVAKTGVTGNRKKGRLVVQYNQSGEMMASYKTIVEAAAAIQSNKSSIRDAINGRQNTAAGFIFKYA